MIFFSKRDSSFRFVRLTKKDLMALEKLMLERARLVRDIIL